MAGKKKSKDKDVAGTLTARITRLKKKLAASPAPDVERRSRKRLKRAQRRRRVIAAAKPAPKKES